MRIVIDIPEEIYRDIQERSTEIQAEGYVLENTVLNGTPLPQEPCGNAISRQAVLDIIEDRIKNGLAENVAISQYYRMEVEKLPPINPQKSPQHTKCNQCPYGETKIVNICNYDGDGCGWD